MTLTIFVTLYCLYVWKLVQKLGVTLLLVFGKPIWKNRVDSWKEKKKEKKASAKKAAAKAQASLVEEQIMDEKE